MTEALAQIAVEILFEVFSEKRLERIAGIAPKIIDFSSSY